MSKSVAAWTTSVREWNQPTSTGSDDEREREEISLCLRWSGRAEREQGFPGGSLFFTADKYQHVFGGRDNFLCGAGE
jgi:hypothetical protein